MSRNRPLWRWWLFCAALELDRRHRWRWAARMWAWCILGEWLGEGADCGEGVPF